VTGIAEFHIKCNGSNLVHVKPFTTCQNAKNKNIIAKIK
jgi:NADPH-dependent 7-cyano-7-deazaguanine reductase QueF-like protein